MKTLKRFFDDIHRIANCAAFPRSLDVVVTLCQEDRDLLANYRRRQPSVTKQKIAIAEEFMESL